MKKIYALLFTLSMTTVSVQAAIKHKVKSGETLTLIAKKHNTSISKLRKANGMKKGDVLGVARVAGILAAKKVDSLIPLTHPLMITKVTLDFQLLEESSMIEIHAVVGICGKTGVEMEALTAVSVAALTIYDMCKAVDKTMVIDNIRLLKKTGGKSGTFTRTG